MLCLWRRARRGGRWNPTPLSLAATGKCDATERNQGLTNSSPALRRMMADALLHRHILSDAVIEPPDVGHLAAFSRAEASQSNLGQKIKQIII